MGIRKADESEGGGGWPAGVRRVVSLVLIFHIVAILTGALSSPPASLLERSLGGMFAPYFQVIDQGYAYRYYVEPPPTPVVTATLRYASRPDEMVRLPGRNVAGPRMRHQRQLALANALFVDVQEAKERIHTCFLCRNELFRDLCNHLCASVSELWVVGSCPCNATMRGN